MILRNCSCVSKLSTFAFGIFAIIYISPFAAEAQRTRDNWNFGRISLPTSFNEDLANYENYQRASSIEDGSNAENYWTKLHRYQNSIQNVRWGAERKKYKSHKSSSSSTIPSWDDTSSGEPWLQSSYLRPPTRSSGKSKQVESLHSKSSSKMYDYKFYDQKIYGGFLKNFENFVHNLPNEFNIGDESPIIKKDDLFQIAQQKNRLNGDYVFIAVPIKTLKLKSDLEQNPRDSY